MTTAATTLTREAATTAARRRLDYIGQDAGSEYHQTEYYGSPANWQVAYDEAARIFDTLNMTVSTSAEVAAAIAHVAAGLGD